MKTIQILSVVLLLLSSILSVNAQNNQYVSVMKENIEKINKWTDSPQRLSATFERVALAEKNKWLPYYYASYANVIVSFSLKTTEEKDNLIEHTQNLIDTAFLLNPDSSELWAMQGFLYLAALQADPMTRSAEYSQKANIAFDKAILLNHNNPRGYYLKGITILYTPEFYGGGKVPAKPIFEQAIAKFDTFTPETELSPIWGKDDCIKQANACKQ